MKQKQACSCVCTCPEGLDKLSTKKLLRLIDQNRVSGRQIAAELIRRSSRLTTERLMDLFRRVPADDKSAVWAILKGRSDLTIQRLRWIEFFCKGDDNFKRIREEIEGLIARLRRHVA